MAESTPTIPTQATPALATLGGGCFWCTEAIFKELKGVEAVVPGYTGGKIENPTYQQVCSGFTGHAEVIQITYDPAVVSYEKLLEVFFKTHDPTTLNQQGNDVGTQYRSSIFPHSEAQRETAKRVIEELNKAEAFSKPIVTTIEPLAKFYPAENYHHDYFAQNGREPYCQLVIRPKVEKFQKAFQDSLKK